MARKLYRRRMRKGRKLLNLRTGERILRVAIAMLLFTMLNTNTFPEVLDEVIIFLSAVLFVTGVIGFCSFRYAMKFFAN